MTDFEKVRAIETRRFAELEATYAECVAIAGRVWLQRLTSAAAEQQTLAETMRDRAIDVGVEALSGAVFSGPPARAEIPVPLFTPRDRAQFLKEVATSLLISADRQNLRVSIEQEPALPFGKSKGTPLAQLDDRTLSEARDWAVTNAAAKYPDFIVAANAELTRRLERATTQPLDARPLALAESERDDPFATVPNA